MGSPQVLAATPQTFYSPESSPPSSPLALPAPPSTTTTTTTTTTTSASAVAAPLPASVTGAAVDGKGSRVVEGIVRRDRRKAVLRRTAVGVRIAALSVSMITFSVMVSDKTQGWDGDSFNRYAEYWYLVAVNVIVFVYSLFQVYSRIHRLFMKKHIISLQFHSLFDFIMDQVLAYLLMSASSSAATRNDDWVSSFGSDRFTEQANAAVAMSFLNFFILALSSVISAYILFSQSF